MLEFLTVALILILDQGLKLWTDRVLTPLGTSISVIDGVFQLTSAHNTGAAWGMLKGWRWFFVALTLAVTIALVVFLVKYRKKLHWLPRLILALIIAGAVGNLIDRVALGYVRDMLYFVLIDFPIFNIADSALSVGCVLLAINILFMKKNSILEFEKHQKPDEAKPDAG